MAVPKYSVIVSVYNIENYIKQCVDSVLQQTVSDFELILVDDGSTDGSGEICDEYAKNHSNVTVLHKQNGGLSDARNVGLSSAKGEYLYFVDGDDWLETTVLEEFDNLLEKYGDLDFIHGRYKIFYQQTQQYDLIPNFIGNDWAIGKTGQEVFVEAYKRDLPIAMGIRGVYSRSFIISNNLYFSKGLYGEDEEWTPRLFFAATKVGGYDGGGYIYRANRFGSLMNTMNLKKRLDLISIYAGWYDFVFKEGCTDEFRDALLQEMCKRSLWCFRDALSALPQSDLNLFFLEFKKHPKLTMKWGRHGGFCGCCCKILFFLTLGSTGIASNLCFITRRLLYMLKKIRRMIIIAVKTMVITKQFCSL